MVFDVNVVENHPGELVLTSPTRAAFIEGDLQTPTPVTVKGSGASSALTINGEHVDVGVDGSFETKVVPVGGLNLIVATDGQARLETPFVYGHFVPVSTAVANAISIELGKDGLEAPLPNASITSAANLALEGRNVVEALRGKTLEGAVTGASFAFTVTGGRHEVPKVQLNSGEVGVGATVQVSKLAVDGNLTIRVAGVPYSHAVRISVDKATILAQSKLSVLQESGALDVQVPVADVFLDGFRFDSNNAGFPCCVDSIVTSYLRGYVEDGVRNGLKNELPRALGLTLEGAGLPNEIDLSSMGVPVRVGIETKLDRGVFDARGGFLSAGVRFEGHAPVGSAGAAAPGWLKLDPKLDPGNTPNFESIRTARPFAVSVSIDAVNQALFAAWASGGLSYVAPDPLKAKLTPSLPPLVGFSGDSLQVQLGEVLVQRSDGNAPFAAATIIQGVSAKIDGDALVLAAEGEPTVSVTYIADGSVGSGLNLIANAARDQIQRIVKPFRVPIPKISLAKLGAGFATQSLSLSSGSLKVNRATNRIGIDGSMVFVK